MIVTPHNPFKKKSSLLDNHHRYELVYRATDNYPKLKPSDIEFKLPQPNYTIHTLTHISETFPNNEFCLIMGEDNLKNFHKWKNYETILEHHQIYVYPRISKGTVTHEFKNHPKIHPVKAPIIELSSTMIRKGIQQQKNIKPLLTKEVWEYIDEMNFYKK